MSMSRALCELQWELQNPISAPKVDHFIPKTPARKESKRKHRVMNCPTNLTNRFLEAKTLQEEVSISNRNDDDAKDCFQVQLAGDLSPEFVKLDKSCDPCQRTTEVVTTMSCSPSSQSSEGSEPYYQSRIGNFPSPKELASVDETFLAKRCNLGYRASRVLKFAQDVVEGKIRLKELEEACRIPCVSNYDKILDQLKAINGFGPFTCANVLMCMGFYHIIPTDTETIRHLKQVCSSFFDILVLHF